MFGHDKTDDDQPVDTTTPAASDDASTPAASQGGITLPPPADDGSGAPALSPTDQTPGFESAPEMQNTPELTTDAGPAASTAIGITSSGTLSDLSTLKQDALHELSPLIGQLNQTPDEKYATAKMVYEETKDQNILNAVYEAAKNLTDEKAKAEAIYDVIQKINELK